MPGGPLVAARRQADEGPCVRGGDAAVAGAMEDLAVAKNGVRERGRHDRIFLVRVLGIVAPAEDERSPLQGDTAATPAEDIAVAEGAEAQGVDVLERRSRYDVIEGEAVGATNGREDPGGGRKARAGDVGPLSAFGGPADGLAGGGKAGALKLTADASPSVPAASDAADTADASGVAVEDQVAVWMSGHGRVFSKGGRGHRRLPRRDPLGRGDGSGASTGARASPIASARSAMVIREGRSRKPQRQGRLGV